MAPNALVIGSDQVASLDGQLLRKPGSAEVAGVRASGSVLKDPGFLRLYGQVAEPQTGANAPEDDAEGDDAKTRLPALAAGDALELREAKAEGHETQPPPRFNEASLVKFMEENGIGRPSTYAETLRKIEQREYVHKKDRRFIPTPLGRLVVDLMKDVQLQRAMEILKATGILEKNGTTQKAETKTAG